MLAVGVGGLIVTGVAVLAVVSAINPQQALRTTTVRPTEVIRIGAGKPSPDPINVPPPQGTIKRMEGVSKAFSKQ